MKAAQFKREGKVFPPEEEAKMKQKTIDHFDEESSCFYSTARLWDDGVILPEDTRKVLGLSVLVATGQDIPETKHGVFRM